ncbi:MAG TPA: tandem-95 repeat protein, partial [Prolixibacteraceae bacterium]|nr:tandem-95 repeat protein [Prolixibacteraceae bacterium]
FDFDSLQILSAINPSAIGELFFNSNPFNGPYPYLILADQIDDASAVFEYYPENGFNGTLSFQWNAHDGYNFALSPARVVFNYINTAPELSNIEITDLSEDELVLLSNSTFLNHYSDIDQYDSPQTFYLSNLPPATEGVFMFGGQVISSDFELPFNQLNQLRFKPALGFEGTTQATWSVSDGDDIGEALIILHYKNAIPVVHNFTVNGYEDVAFTFSLSDFDKSPDINIPFEDEDYFDRLQMLRIIALPKHGQLTFNGLPVFADLEIPRNQIIQLKYLSDFDWNGTDTLIYTAFDGTDWASNQAAVFIELAPVNDAPRPMADYYSILEDQTLSGVNVGVNDNDVDNDHASLRYHIEPLDSASAGQNGTITLNQNGDLTFVPDNDFNGWAYFIYSVCDPIGACARDTVYITVAPTNDAPLA